MSARPLMSDPQQTPLLRVADSESPLAAVSAGVQAGALLRSYRERARLDLEALAAVVKVPVRRLEALEAGRLDALPEPVYVRAMVLVYAGSPSRSAAGAGALAHHGRAAAAAGRRHRAGSLPFPGERYAPGVW